MSDHKVEGMKGKLKETVGDVTGDKGLQLEGKLDQAVATAKQKTDELTEKLTKSLNGTPDDNHGSAK